MESKEQYIQELKAQLYEWQTHLDNIKAKLGGASIGGKMEMNQMLTDFENQIEEGKAKLAELEVSNDEDWDLTKDGVDTVWATITTTYYDVSSKFEE